MFPAQCVNELFRRSFVGDQSMNFFDRSNAKETTPSKDSGPVTAFQGTDISDCGLGLAALGWFGWTFLGLLCFGWISFPQLRIPLPSRLCHLSYPGFALLILIEW